MSNVQQALNQLYAAYQSGDWEAFMAGFETDTIRQLSHNYTQLPVVDLIPELEHGVSDVIGLRGIFTKFYHQILTPPQFNGIANVHYMHNAMRARRALEQENYSTYLFAHEKPYRTQALYDIEPNLTSPVFWECVNEIWTAIENVHQECDLWFEMLNNRAHNAWLSEQPERHNKAAIPAEAKMDNGMLQLYRGLPVEDESDFDIMEGTHFSWTTDIERGRWFARRFCGDGKRPHLIRCLVSVDDVLFYTDSRNESEVVIPDSSLTESVTITVL